MKKELTTPNHNLNDEEQKHSLVCNDQLFFQELRIAAEEAEKDYEDQRE